jgi:hypothetical protein
MRTAPTLALISLSLAACTPIGTLRTRDLPPDLPATYVFPMSTPEVRSRLLEGLQVSAERIDPFYRRFGFVNSSSGNFAPVVVDESESGKVREQFPQVSTSSDLMPIRLTYGAVDSAYYFTFGGPVPYTMTFAVEIEPRGTSHSAVTVRSFDTKIYVSSEFSAHAMGFVPAATPVPPVKAEEYKLLVYIAHVLGVELAPLAAAK